MKSNTLSFLKELEQNNNREWFQTHKSWYDESRQDFSGFVQRVASELLSEDEIEKTKIYRIYRDLRFSKDKTPYKTHLAAHFTRKGKYRRGGFYFHMSSSEVFVGGGFWGPSREDLKYIRDGILSDPVPLRDALAKQTIIDRFGALHGDELKTAPQGIDREHSDIDLLRKKQFTLVRSYPPARVTEPEFYTEIAADFIAMIPVLQVLTEYLVYDNNGVERE